MAALNKCIFPKKSGRLSSVGPEILAFMSRCSIDFQLILDCFIPNFELKYEYSENIKTDHVNKVVFNLHQIKFRPFFFGTPDISTNYPSRASQCFSKFCIRGLKPD